MILGNRNNISIQVLTDRIVPVSSLLHSVAAIVFIVVCLVYFNNRIEDFLAYAYFDHRSEEFWRVLSDEYKNYAPQQGDVTNTDTPEDEIRRIISFPLVESSFYITNEKHLVVLDRIRGDILRYELDLSKYKRIITRFDLNWGNLDRYSKIENIKDASEIERKQVLIDRIIQDISNSNNKNAKFSYSPLRFPHDPLLFIRSSDGASHIGYMLDSFKLCNEIGPKLLSKNRMNDLFWVGIGEYPDEFTIRRNDSSNLRHVSLIPKNVIEITVRSKISLLMWAVSAIVIIIELLVAAKAIRYLRHARVSAAT